MHNFLHFLVMPKTSLPKAVWIDRLKKYAVGEFKFSTGMKPPPASKWDIELRKVDLCPAHKVYSKLTVFLKGTRPKCECSYHPKKTTPTKVSVFII